MSLKETGGVRHVEHEASNDWVKNTISWKLKGILPFLGKENLW